MVWMLLGGHHFNKIDKKAEYSIECILMPRKCKTEIAKEEDDRESISNEDNDDVYVRYQPEF